jgi:hypothetical protein
MPVSLPERTVDAWVTAYVVEQVADALLWTPTQRQSPDYDLAGSLPGPGKLFVFENKAPYTKGGAHGFHLPVRQMWNYLCDARLSSRTFYVLPCPPFGVEEVSGGRGAAELLTRDLIPERARSRLAGHRWHPTVGCEEWFRVVPVLDLWRKLLRDPPPVPGDPYWPKRKRGEARTAPQGAPAKEALSPSCSVLTAIGDSLEKFMDGILKCDRSELRIDPEQTNNADIFAADGDNESPFHQALVTFAPASSLPGWTR